MKSLFQNISFGCLVAFLTSCACDDMTKANFAQMSKNDESEEIAALEIVEMRPIAVEYAEADIRSFKESSIKGLVTFTKVKDGIKVVADVEGLSPGKHGFHIHEKGDCSSEDSVGEHFNPTGHKHGSPEDLDSHIGDLGNIIAENNGKAHYERVDHRLTFVGQNSILGRSIVIHADPDDYKTQPTGASGKKIACGVIKESKRSQ